MSSVLTNSTFLFFCTNSYTGTNRVAFFFFPRKNDNIHFEHHVKWELCQSIANKTSTVISESREKIWKKLSRQLGVRMLEAEQNYHSKLGVTTRNTNKIVTVNMRKWGSMKERCTLTKGLLQLQSLYSSV